MVNILIEGCDCVGKTSLLNEFLDYQDQYRSSKDVFTTKHFEAPDKKLSQEQQKEVMKKLYETEIKHLNSTDNNIYDRFMLGEAVYAPIFRNYYPEYIRSFEKQLSDNNVLVLLTASPVVVKQRFDGKFIKEEQIEKILKDYEIEFLASSMKRKIKIDTTNTSKQDVFNKVYDYAYKKTK